MWGRHRRQVAEASSASEPPGRLRDALRQARIEQAERTSVVIDLQNAELARLELLNDALDPLFQEIPAEVDLFDRGISRGETPRLWTDAVTHVDMGRDKRIYRFLQDTRLGRQVLAESNNVIEIVDAVTKYVAQRLIERERALADSLPPPRERRRDLRIEWRRKRWRALRAFLLGLFVGAAGLIAAALLFEPKS
jgi:hypothetical protein